MMTIPGYDNYILGGDTHESDMLAYCPNIECKCYGEIDGYVVSVSYGYVDDDLECDECFTTLETDDYMIAAMRRENKRTEQLEARFLAEIKAGTNPFEIVFD